MMLGDSYGYSLSPISGCGTLRANGRGYISGLGDDLTITERAEVNAFMDKHACGESTARAQLGYPPIGSTTGTTAGKVDWSKVPKTVEAFTQAGTSVGMSIAQIVAAIKGNVPASSDRDRGLAGLQLQQYIPWAIGGAAVLVGLFMVMGTRRRR